MTRFRLAAEDIRTGPRIVVIGVMGTGKTTVGRLLAGRLGWNFWDNDQALRADTGTTAADLQRDAGLDALHATEDRLLRAALAARSETVFAAAASVVLNPDVLSGTFTVWLRASAAREAENISHSGQHHRPRLADDPEAALPHVRAIREPMYAALADITVEVADGAGATCDRVIEALTARQT